MNNPDSMPISSIEDDCLCQLKPSANKIILSDSWDGCNSQEKWKTKAMQNFGGQTRSIMGDVQMVNKMSVVFFLQKIYSCTCSYFPYYIGV